MLVHRYLLMLLVFLVLFFGAIAQIHVSWGSTWGSNTDQRLSVGEVRAKIDTSVRVGTASPGTPDPLEPPATPL